MVRTILFAGACSFITVCNRAEEAESYWDWAVNVRGAVGYKDNILLSNFQKERSAFWQSGLDFMLFGTAGNGSSYSLSLAGNDRRYFSSPTVRKEQDASAWLSWSWPFQEKFETGFDLSYFYLDTVMDASVDELLITSVQVKTHVISFAPYISYNLPNDWFVKLTPEVERDYVDVLDDHTEWGPKITGGKRYGHKSSATLSYSYHWRYYDTRPQVMLDYTRVPGTSLVFDQHEIEARLKHNWDAERHWRNSLRAAFERNEDNGFGFFDYNKYRFGGGFEYHEEKWNVVTEARIFFYDYDKQPVTEPGSDKWHRWNYLLGFRAERNVTEKLKLFVESEHEWTISNDPFTEYEVNTVMTGVDWEF